MTQPIEFWFEFASTYSYPAAERVRAALRAGAVSVVYRPLLLGPIFRAQGWNDSPFNLYPVKGRYMWQELTRRCETLGLPFRKPTRFPQNGLTAARLCTALADHPQLPELVCALYRANFVDDRDLSDRAELGRVLESLGLDATQALARLADPGVKDTLRAGQEAAQAHGIFGAPSFVVDGELFWGEDRFEQALARAEVPCAIEGLCLRPYRAGDQDAVVALWHEAELLIPHNDPLADLALKRAHQPELFLVAEWQGALVGSCMAGFDGRRGWLNYLAVREAWRRRGFGAALVGAAEARLRARGCPKLNLQVRSSKLRVLDFYARLGYSVDDRTSLGKRLIDRE
jgi:2-hydroxychromene-2-carboxylate isomerase/predicted N-acetyltransferase YhbS